MNEIFGLQTARTEQETRDSDSYGNESIGEVESIDRVGPTGSDDPDSRDPNSLGRIALKSTVEEQTIRTHGLKRKLPLVTITTDPDKTGKTASEGPSKSIGGDDETDKWRRKTSGVKTIGREQKTRYRELELRKQLAAMHDRLKMSEKERYDLLDAIRRMPGHKSLTIARKENADR